MSDQYAELLRCFYMCSLYQFGYGKADNEKYRKIVKKGSETGGAVTTTSVLVLLTYFHATCTLSFCPSLSNQAPSSSSSSGLVHLDSGS